MRTILISKEVAPFHVTSSVHNPRALTNNDKEFT